jgi:hypothetical protein
LELPSFELRSSRKHQCKDHVIGKCKSFRAQSLEGCKRVKCKFLRSAFHGAFEVWAWKL